MLFESVYVVKLYCGHRSPAPVMLAAWAVVLVEVLRVVVLALDVLKVVIVLVEELVTVLDEDDEDVLTLDDVEEREAVVDDVEVVFNAMSAVAEVDAVVEAVDVVAVVATDVLDIEDAVDVDVDVNGDVDVDVVGVAYAARRIPNQFDQTTCMIRHSGMYLPAIRVVNNVAVLTKAWGVSVLSKH